MSLVRLLYVVGRQVLNLVPGVEMGVRAIVLTPNGRIVLVRQRYTRGWHVPAGGQQRGESAATAIRRELREEIGYVSAASVTAVKQTLYRRAWRRFQAVTFVARDVVYKAQPSLEIAEIAEFEIDQLPDDLSPSSAACLADYLAIAQPKAA